ncbi:MAG: hypothetical protein ACYTBJ_27210, partial [Planctomycetota bacterium]
IQRELAAIEAARAIPDGQNAAIIYNELSARVEEAFSTNTLNTFYQVQNEWWRSSDYPQLAKWLAEQEQVIEQLAEACRRQQCRFPIPTDPDEWRAFERSIAAVGFWATLLTCSANNDAAEGRIAQGVEKYFCVIQVCEHLCQQPTFKSFMVGVSIEGRAAKNLSRIIAEDKVRQHLNATENSLPAIENNWEQTWADICRMEDLYESYRIEWLRNVKLRRKNRKRMMNRAHQRYLQMLCGRRGLWLLGALRRYRNEHARWPETLSEIQDLVPAQALVDPTNNGSFVYKLTDDGFRLYSRGRNDIDEDIELARSNDDIFIWPEKKQRWRAGCIRAGRAARYSS